MRKWSASRPPCLLLFPVLSAHHPHLCLWAAFGIAPWLSITTMDYRPDSLLENLSWQQQWWVGGERTGTGRKTLSFRFLLSYFGSVCWLILVLLAANSKWSYLRIMIIKWLRSLYFSLARRLIMLRRSVSWLHVQSPWTWQNLCLVWVGSYELWQFLFFFFLSGKWDYCSAFI